MAGKDYPTTMRKIKAQRMHKAVHHGSSYPSITVDMTSGELRGQLKEQKVKVSYNDIIIRCVASLNGIPYAECLFDKIVEKM